MSRIPEQDAETIESLTEAANIAASKGEWNLVQECYRRREAVLAQKGISDVVLTRVRAIDREVAERARLAQAGLASLLRDVGLLRRRLQDVRRWAVEPPVDSSLVARHI